MTSFGNFPNFLLVLGSDSVVLLNLEAHYFRSGNCIVFLLKFFQLEPLGFLFFFFLFNPDFYLAISSLEDRNNSLERDPKLAYEDYGLCRYT